MYWWQIFIFLLQYKRSESGQWEPRCVLVCAGWDLCTRVTMVGTWSPGHMESAEWHGTVSPTGRHWHRQTWLLREQILSPQCIVAQCVFKSHMLVSVTWTPCVTRVTALRGDAGWRSDWRWRCYGQHRMDTHRRVTTPYTYDRQSSFRTRDQVGLVSWWTIL